MSETKMIEITVEAPIQTGKSSIVTSIKNLLETYGYCVAIPERCLRNDMSPSLEFAEPHERPSKDNSVIVLKETCKN